MTTFLSHFAERTGQGSPRGTRGTRRRPTRLHMESLEERRLMAVTVAHAVFRGERQDRDFFDTREFYLILIDRNIDLRRQTAHGQDRY